MEREEQVKAIIDVIMDTILKSCEMADLEPIIVEGQLAFIDKREDKIYIAGE